MNEYWEAWTGSERESFQRACRNFLVKTFLVRDKDEESRRNYFFVVRNLEAFNTYFGYIGFEVMLDRDNAVAMLRNKPSLMENSKRQSGHRILRKMESLVLCCLWTLYAERLRQGTLAQKITVTIPELRFEMEKYDIREMPDKSSMNAILSLFAQYNLLDMEGRIGDENFRICLYPSMQFAMDREAFARCAGDAGARMHGRQDSEEGEEEERDESEE